MRWAERMLWPELTVTGYLGAGGCISCCWRAEIWPEPGVGARLLGDWGGAICLGEGAGRGEVTPARGEGGGGGCPGRGEVRPG